MDVCLQRLHMVWAHAHTSVSVLQDPDGGQSAQDYAVYRENGTHPVQHVI